MSPSGRAQVWRPTWPSTGIPACCCAPRTTAAVIGPYSPSSASTGSEADEPAPSDVQCVLEFLDYRPAGTLGQCRRLRAAAAQRRPGGRSDHAVGSEVPAALELLHGRLGLRAEDAVDLAIGHEVGQADKQVLGPLDRLSARAF